MSDKINLEHYKRLPAEAIEIIESAIQNAPTCQDAYLHGQVLKYLLRCWHKEGITDIKKAKWYLDRLIESYDKSLADIKQGNLRAKQIDEQPKWTPKIGDWVKINKPSETQVFANCWFTEMDKYDGQVIQANRVEHGSVVHDSFAFLFKWLEPAEAPQQPPNEQPQLPEGWRWLDADEVIRKGDAYRYCGKWWDYVNSIGLKVINTQWPSIRRNKFEVGEKVLSTLDDLQFVVVDNHNTLSDVYIVRKENGGTIHNILGKLLAPYIEDAKPAEAPQQPPKEPQLPDGWRWLEVGEVIRKGDSYWYGARWYDYDCSIGEQLAADTWPSIRRSRFEIGEKVIRCVNNRIGIVNDIELIGRDKCVLYHVEMQDTKGINEFFENELAPYIEDTK